MYNFSPSKNAEARMAILPVFQAYENVLRNQRRKKPRSVAKTFRLHKRVWGYSLTQMRPILVPSQLVFQLYPQDEQPATVLGELRRRARLWIGQSSLLNVLMLLS